MTALAIVSVATEARADDAPINAADRARAQQLFESALADAEAGRYDVACPKFAASQQTDPKTSTLLNLGRCWESLGRTASAWAAFREAEALARKVGRPDLEVTARSLAEGLVPKLVRLTIVVPEPARVADLVVSRDGRKLTSAEWGVGIPVDAGEHEVVAEAPGRARWSTRVAVQSESRSVEIPALEVASSPAPVLPPSTPEAPAPSERAPTWWTPMRTTGVALAGAGAASLLVGLGISLVAKSSYDDARAECRAADDCPSSAVRDGESARSLANGATVVMLSGALVGAVGGALILFAPRASRAGEGASHARTLRVGVGPGTLGVSGSW